MLADLIILGIIAICTIIGYRAGLVKTALSAVSYILSIIIACMLYDVVAEILMNTPLYDSLLEMVGGYVGTSGTEPAGTFGNYLPGASGLVSMGIGAMIVGLIVKIIAFVIVVVLCKILISLLSNILNLFTRIPVINQFNRIGGLVVGVAIGIVVAYIVLALVLVCEPMLTDTFAMEQLEESWIASVIYEHNFLISLIG